MSVIYARLSAVSCCVLVDWLVCMFVCDALLAMYLPITFCRLPCNGIRFQERFRNGFAIIWSYLVITWGSCGYRWQHFSKSGTMFRTMTVLIEFRSGKTFGQPFGNNSALRGPCGGLVVTSVVVCMVTALIWSRGPPVDGLMCLSYSKYRVNQNSEVPI